MRPLRLKMTGFGPYRETNVIDMESLGRGGLYLITGDTGAGKTFIFDAITYALYGDMSGSGRDTKSVRSQYSADGDKTEVELVFEYCGRRYMVTRNPEYNRAKKSGEGFTKQTAGATLIKPDGSAVDGTSKVNEEIRNILGIDKGQFCSIAMIAQGEFRKVLNAGTDERQKLFRKLFNTQPYSMLADELKELSRRNQEKYNDSIRGINLCLSAVSCSFDESLSDELEELRERAEDKKAMSEEICELLGSIINKGTERAAHLSEELAEVDNTLTGLNNTIALAKDHRKNVKSLEDARNASTADNDETKAKKEQLEKNNMLMGLTDVEGDGIVVTIKDSISSNPSEDLNSYLVHDGDIREIVSELENAGAEAIEINGQRVVSSTCIVCAGNIISVNGEKVNSPFVIKAIGNQESLYSITRPGGYLQILQSATIPAEVKKESNIIIGKYNGAIPQKYLKEDK